MAEKRMFSKTIVDSDAFLEMPLSSQALYFHLSMRADDDGFLNNARGIMGTIGANKNDYDLLVAKRFVIKLDDGICVIKHWRINNYLRGDRYKETIHKEQKQLLEIKDNGAYTFADDLKEIKLGIPNDNHSDTQSSIDKNRVDKSSIDKSREVKHKFGEFNHVRLKDSESEKLISELGQDIFDKCIRHLDEYMEMHNKKYANCNLVIRKWVIEAVTKEKGAKKVDGPRKETPKPTNGLYEQALARGMQFEEGEEVFV